MLPYFIPYLRCPDTGIIVEGCNCLICAQHRKEWLQNHNKEFYMEEEQCNHFWIIDSMHDWYVCTKCYHIRRSSKGIAIKPSELESIEFNLSWSMYCKDRDGKYRDNSNPCSKGFKWLNLSPVICK